MEHDAGRFEDLVGVGGDPCLDLANTVSSRGTERQFDRLETYRDLVTWAQLAGLITQSKASQLDAAAVLSPDEAVSCFADAIRWREALHNIGEGFAHGRDTSADIAAFSELLFPMIATSRLTSTSAGGMELSIKSDHLAFSGPLWIVAWSAFRLFTGNEVTRLRQCENDGCTWLFLDRSKNRSRRWCSMRQCGSVVKAREYRARIKNR